MAKDVNKSTTTNNIADISFEPIRKKRFRIDGDDNRILELNTADLNIIVRLKETYPKLVELANSAFANMPDVDVTEDYNFAEDEATALVIDALADADKKMREQIDYIFDSNVSEMCAPSGSMYDPIDGKCRFEYIIETLSSLYENDMEKELSKMSTRVKRHTSKYTRAKKG